MTRPDNLDAAHAYARRGWRALPLHHITADGACSCHLGRACPGPGKHPIHRNWPKTASASGADIQAWWDETPDAGVGIATGTASGIWVLDLDGADGIATLTALVDEHGPLPPTRIVRTGSGGLHYYFTQPRGFIVRNSSRWIGPGVDVRGEGGQVVAPPSTSGRGPYVLLADRDPTDAPEWLLALVREHAGNCEAGRTVEVKQAEPVDVSFLPPDIRTLVSTLVEPDQGRYRAFHALVAACRAAKFTQGQTVTIATPWCLTVGKFANRVAAEVARSWAKLDAAEERAEAWLPGVTSGSSSLAPEPRPAPAAVPDDTPAAKDEASAGPPLPASWAPIDLTDIVGGTHVVEVPAGMPRVDGAGLLYPGRVHSFHGESESGKSLVAQAEAARILADPDAGRVLYVDWEADQVAVVGRLLALGAPDKAALDRLDYIRPEAAPYALPEEREAWAALLAQRYDLAVLDGVTEALVTSGGATKDNDEITKWVRAVPRRIAQRTGAAVVLIDHVSKDTEGRGRFAIGGQAKMAALDGAAYVVEIVEALGRGLRGAVTLRVAKDRPGGVRPNCGPYRKSDRTQEAARVIVDSTFGEFIVVTIQPPRQKVDEGGPGGGEFRPTLLMERASMFLEGRIGASSTRVVLAGVSGKEKAVTEALRILAAEGWITSEAGARGAILHESLRPYRQVTDPLSDAYDGWIEGDS